MSNTAELMQTTVPLTWNKPEWMLPEAGKDLILAVDSGEMLKGGFNGVEGNFFFEYGDLGLSEVDFWAYMPKHPTR